MNWVAILLSSPAQAGFFSRLTVQYPAPEILMPFFRSPDKPFTIDEMGPGSAPAISYSTLRFELVSADERTRVAVYTLVMA